LHDRRADAATAPIDEQDFSTLKFRVLHQANMSGEADQRYGDYIFITHASRNGIEPAFIYNRELCESSRAIFGTLIG
jgi:hypothetical protein